MNELDNLLVVKIGGAEGVDIEAACDDLANVAQNNQLVVVHGVSAEMNRLCAERGAKVQTLTSPSGHSSRYTTPEIRDLYVEAATRTNAEIVELLRRRNIAAHGFTGGNVALQGSRKKAIRAVIKGRTRVIRDDHSGSIKHVDRERLLTSIIDGLVPVLPPMALGDDDEGMLNVDGDRAAAAVAGALNAVTQVIVSNIDGLYRSFPDPNTIVRTVNQGEIVDALDWAQGRMKRKVLAAKEALDAGVEQVIITNGHINNAISKAIEGLVGTVFTGHTSDDD